MNFEVKLEQEIREALGSRRWITSRRHSYDLEDLHPDSSQREDLITLVWLRIVKQWEKSGLAAFFTQPEYDKKHRKNLYIFAAVDVLLDENKTQKQRMHRSSLRFEEMNEEQVEQAVMEFTFGATRKLVSELKWSHREHDDPEGQLFGFATPATKKAVLHLSNLVRGGGYKRLSSSQMLLARDLLKDIYEQHHCGTLLVDRTALANFLGYQVRVIDKMRREKRIPTYGMARGRSGKMTATFNLLEVAEHLLTQEKVELRC